MSRKNKEPFYISHEELQEKIQEFLDKGGVIEKLKSEEDEPKNENDE